MFFGYITNIYFGNNFNQLINNLPNSLEYIKFGDYHFNQSIDNLPNNIREIYLGENYKVPINIFPKKLEKIFVSYSFAQETEEFKKMIKKNNIKYERAPGLKGEMGSIGQSVYSLHIVIVK